MAEIRDRVVELRRIPAGELIPNPANWRRHPPEQVAALRGVLGQIGFADVAIGIERDGGVMLVDGHVRTEEVPADFEVPTLIVDLDDGEANLLLASLDPIAAMANTDAAALSSLLVGLEAENEGVEMLLASLAGDVEARLARDGNAPGEFPAIDPDDFDLQHECPRCGFEFSD